MESVESQNKLENIVKELKKKRNNYFLLKSSSRVAIIFFIALGAALLLSLLSSNPVYYLILKIFVLLALICGLVKEIALPMLRESKDGDIFQELDTRSRGLGEDTLSALELNENLDNSSRLGTSKELSIAHIDKITARLASLELSSLFPVRKLRSHFIQALSGLIIATLLLIFIPGGFQKYLFSFNLGPANTSTTLRLANIEITLSYPEYTKLPQKSIKATKGDINVLKGTRVHFQADPLDSFREGSLVVEGGISVPATIVDGRIQSEFTALSAGSFFIKETTRDLSSESFKITIEDDNDPLIQISSPLGDTIELGSEEKIDIFYEAHDDYEISKLSLSWENQREQSDIPIEINEKQKNSVEGKISWGPGSISPGHGDTIKLEVLAYDNDIISGPKVGISNSITIKLKDARSKHEETLNLAERLMEELIDILADEINMADLRKQEPEQSAKSKRTQIDTNQMNDQKKLTSKIEHANNTLQMTLSSMKEDEYSDFTNFVALSNMEMRITNLLLERKHLIESFSKLDVGRLNRLMKREAIEFEDDILFLDSIIKGNKLMDSLYSSNDLLSKYSELSELLKQMEQGDSAQLSEQLQEMINQISELMAQLAEKMNGLGGEIQEGFLNQDAFEAMNMQDQLSEISKLAQEGKIEEALQMLANMTQSLQNMIASLENGMQGFGSSIMSQGMSKLNDLMARIEEIEKQETILRDKTDNYKESMLSNSASNGEKFREFVDKQKNKIQELSQLLEEARAKILENAPPGSDPQSSYFTEKMLDRAEQLENWFKAMDFKQAQKHAKFIKDSSKGLMDAGKSTSDNFGEVPNEIDRANRLAREIERELERVNKNESVEKQHSIMAGRQDEIQAETDQLNNEIKDPESGYFMTPGIGENLELAENFMGNASKDLRDQELSKAISNQDEALKALRQAKEQAQQMMQQMQMSARGNGMPAPMMLGQGMMRPGGTQGVDTQYVEIPKIDESLVGKEYKQKILEAMKAGSPEGYIELNKKYYDRIIK